MDQHAPHEISFVRLDDDHIWKYFRAGNREAFSFIYRSQLEVLFNYGMKVVNDRSLVKDAIQELFIDLWKSRQNLSPTNNIRFYLFKALRRKLVREIKNSRLRTEKYIQHLDGEITVHSPEYAQIAVELSAQRKTILVKALKEISLRQQEVLNLLFYENYSYEQISELMSINVSSVYTLAWKAMTALKKVLKEKDLNG